MEERGNMDASFSSSLLDNPAMSARYRKLFKLFLIFVVAMFLAALVIGFLWWLFGNAYWKEFAFFYCFKWTFAVMESMGLALFIADFIRLWRRAHRFYKKFGPLGLPKFATGQAMQDYEWYKRMRKARPGSFTDESFIKTMQAKNWADIRGKSAK